MPAIDGLSSGLDTGNIIKQLMQLERMPQARLQSKQNATESSLGSLRTLNTKFLSMSGAATALGALRPGTVPTTPPSPASGSSPARPRATRRGPPLRRRRRPGRRPDLPRQAARRRGQLPERRLRGTTAPVALDGGAPRPA
jgi:hypothetical protein